MDLEHSLCNQDIVPAHSPVVESHISGSTDHKAQILELEAKIARLEDEKIISEQQHEQEIFDLTQVISAKVTQNAGNKRALAHYGAHSRSLELKLMNLKEELQENNRESLNMNKMHKIAMNFLQKKIQLLQEQRRECDDEIANLTYLISKPIPIAPRSPDIFSKLVQVNNLLQSQIASFITAEDTANGQIQELKQEQILHLKEIQFLQDKQVEARKLLYNRKIKNDGKWKKSDESLTLIPQNKRKLEDEIVDESDECEDSAATQPKKKIKVEADEKLILSSYGSTLSKIHKVERKYTCSKKYICHECGSTLMSRRSLLQHLRKHFGETVQECPVCGIRYASQTILKKHVKSHSNSYSCYLCSKMYSSSRYLSQHLQLHATTLNFDCKYCEEKFQTVGKLRCHVLGKHFEKRTCEICSFRTIHYLRHVKTRHFDADKEVLDNLIQKIKCMKANYVTLKFE